MEKAEFIELYSKADAGTKQLIEQLLTGLDCITYYKVCKALSVPLDTFLKDANKNKLKALIDASGLSRRYIAERIGISYRSYLNRENGKTEFRSNEISILKDLLGLSKQETADLFFPQ